ncbi:glutamyl-tRNA amidotransferase [Oleiphilus sp. HI0071]|uniref:GatB/YqeY domain-containing protein n=1 Tax=unclassified Oleiphilus TaxID=2631174 RepID=UPI0007C3D474|nr:MULTISPECIES: GatB/YqeY domain-containing protein [unclassified Oleiphilus]KZY67034.1 glutamyl-tRNA amidotransferase [Oleiphilus sp. HI0065]KZY81151.1 glutamyl-tRNA amidotransferase [Oleiphilus sp. HI0071]KZZ06252.1 glutamyl-tRNA amidotransferase [Oleiphilus sp. HI0073]KZZ43000.1 glutamyl-tRNA amidotransferase [Oleiphilus sp. HI0118]KZZ49947.1 glutamyl-tRNA amidotransferase [Oleiphilus sp. HI0122]KZZ77445.1 glutamyl-tRNA amidotransferase [Oleiphilus sp. HI0133]
MSDAGLKASITSAMKEAMRAKEKERLATIRLILADFKRIEVDERIELDDARCLAILDKMLKQRKDSITQYRDAGREDLAEIEECEVEVIQTFLPKALSEDEIEALIGSAMSETGAESVRDMGKVMAVLKPQLQGRADVGAVSGMVKKRLAS